MNAFKPYRKNYRMNIFFLQFCNLFKFYGLHNGNEIGTFPYSCLNCKSIFASFKIRYQRPCTLIAVQIFK